MVKDAMHVLFGLTHGKTADRVTVEADLRRPSSDTSRSGS